MKKAEILIKNGMGRLFGVALLLLTTAICLCRSANAEVPFVDAPHEKVTMSAAGAISPTQHFAISPQLLVTALDCFGETTGIHIFYNSRLTKGLISPGATGVFTAEEALRKLLAGIPLVSLGIENQCHLPWSSR